MTRIVRLAFAGVIPAVFLTGTLVIATPAAHSDSSRLPVASHPADVQNRKAQIEYRERLQLESARPTKAQIEYDERK